jgi:hypothetical protein
MKFLFLLAATSVFAADVQFSICDAKDVKLVKDGAVIDGRNGVVKVDPSEYTLEWTPTRTTRGANSMTVSIQGDGEIYINDQQARCKL